MRRSSVATRAIALAAAVAATDLSGGDPCARCGLDCRPGGGGPMPGSTLPVAEAVWLPERPHVYLGSPSILQLDDGSWLLSHDFFGESTCDATVQLLRAPSRDGPFEPVGAVSPMYWATLFRHAGATYLIGVDSGDGAAPRSVVISRSRDGGATWTAPSTIFEGHSAETSWHTAPTPVVLSPRDGRLYKGFEFGRLYAHATLIYTRAAVGVDTDLLDPDVWTMAEPAVFNATTMVPASWGPPCRRGVDDYCSPWGWQEGGAIVGPGGRPALMLRVDGQTSRTHNKAALLFLEDGAVRFEAMVDFPSTNSKFVVRRASGGGDFYTISNNVTERAAAAGHAWARGTLVLATSTDLRRWKICATLLVDDSGLDEGASDALVGFHYVDWTFDGDDIAYAARSGYRGGHSMHDANRILSGVVERYSEIRGAKPN